jgi:hypothetical protein
LPPPWVLSMGTIGAVAPVALGVAQAAGIDPMLMAGPSSPAPCSGTTSPSSQTPPSLPPAARAAR